jgi:hypothetical protein
MRHQKKPFGATVQIGTLKARPPILVRDVASGWTCDWVRWDGLSVGRDRNRYRLCGYVPLWPELSVRQQFAIIQEAAIQEEKARKS